MKKDSQNKMPLPKVFQSSCLRMRFSASSCRRCLDVCPNKALNLDGGLALDSSLCAGCQLCSKACPSGALSLDISLSSFLKVLKHQTPIVIACQKAPQDSHLNTSCLAFISEEFLLALFLADTPGISLNLINCGACVNNSGINHLKENLVAVEAKSGLPISRKIKLIEAPDQLHFQGETCDRRGFFRALTRSIVSEAVTLLSSKAVVEPENKVYAEKQLPFARALLKTVLEKLPEEERKRFIELFAGRLLRGESCDGCRACTKVCPTGALLENYDETQAPFEFNAVNCTACGLCVEFCINEALQLVTT